MTHYLDIIVEDRLLNTTFIDVFDRTVYNSRIPVENAVLKVEVPGKSDFVLPRFTRGDLNTYTTRSLKFYKNVKETFELPDGIYTFTYSVCPNELLYCKVIHFRTANLQKKLNELIVQSLLNTCDEQYTDQFFATKMINQNKLTTVKFIIDAVKIYAKKGNLKQATDLYNRATKIIDNYGL